ncbi:nuclear transport factor 2 family protein [Singulisphaera sp. Ch08]|uniref:Nuclear transport factor 2 family protein n=1 Tax=Singulisphaera sp. Ch08 TaxID=3120278 RepID=A0AAU7C750_9BACT
MADLQDHVNALRQAYQQWNSTRGENAQVWLDLFSDDITMRSLGGDAAAFDFAKPRHGKADAEQYFADVLAAWEMVHFTPEDFIAEADRVVVVSRVAYKYRETGKVAESPKADIFRFRDGKVIEFTEFFDTAAALAATQPD